MFQMFTRQCQNDSYEVMFCLWYIILFIILLKNIFVTCFFLPFDFFQSLSDFTFTMFCYRVG